MSKFLGVKVGDKTYDPWCTQDEVYALNNQGNAGLGAELQSGKTAIASAITAKGGTSSTSHSLAELATDIVSIPTTVQVEDAAKLAFPESISWNILALAYEKQRVGYKSWIVAEYFKGYDSLALSGADAYLTCDGDFYTSATTHVWHDDDYNKVNRYVVFYFLGENIPFSVTQESLCPRSIAVMGKFSSINIASVGRIRQIYNGGEINDISFASTNPDWGQEVFLSGVKEHNSGYIVNGNANVQLFTSDIETLNGGYLIYGDNQAITTVICPKLKVINSGFMDNYVTFPFPNVSTFELPELEELNSYIWFTWSWLDTIPLDTMKLPKLKKISTTGYVFYGGTNFDYFLNFKKVILPSLIECKSTFVGGKGISWLNNVITFEIGQNFNGNFNLSRWIATNAIKDTDNSLVDEGETFANNREKFLYNFEHYIVDKLADNSVSGLAYTLTVKSTTVFPVVNASATITAKLTAKNWTLAGA